jgi:peptidoglycan glycosyltransferase
MPARGADSPLLQAPVEAAHPHVEERAPSEPARPWAVDPELSRAASKLLEQAHPVEGAAVLVDVKTGRILVFSELRHGGAPGSVITAAKAPAASVFKLVTTAALFEVGGVRPADRVCISGGVKTIERRHLDAPRGGIQSCGSFSQALGHSRNAVYAQLATRRLARQDLVDVAERLGFNSSVPFDWPVPVGHLVVPYNDLDFARTAAGFENSTLSPLGGAYLVSIIARGGVAPHFHLASDPGDEPAPEAVRLLSATTARRMTHMMEVTVSSGTSRLIFNDEAGHSLLPGVRVAGKTGTLRPETRHETTSWFVGFAPSDRPEVAISVMLENGPVWRQRAAEVARDLLRVYFHRRGMPSIIDPLSAG